ncbi:MAG: two-component regulator propeller domain-containing protein [Bryobacteraceae bacterium]|jgi:signal transduction histidine kinase/ligand-binding sensor domain-containing protein
MRSTPRRTWAAVALALALAPAGVALDPARRITQYIHRVWTQEDGLPQDTVRAIAQTPDGYLWIGTEEGLASFDGYDFTTFNRRSGALPNDSVTALAVAGDGTLWAGTPGGLVSRNDGAWRTLARAEGLAEPSIVSIATASGGADARVWVVAGDTVYEVSTGRARAAEFEPAWARRDARVVQIAPDGALWVAGFRGIFRVEGQRARMVVPAAELRGGVPVTLRIDPDGTLWAGLTGGLLRAGPGWGVVQRYTTRDGLPNSFVRVLRRDRDGVLWAGTNGGLARLENGRFLAETTEESVEQELVRSLFEDREGNLWVGTNSGLTCFHDGRFLLFSRPEGLPGDKPTVVHQDRSGAVWIGFHDRGLYRFRPGPNLRYTAENGLPSNEVFSIRDGAGGALLIGTREGAVEWKDGRFRPLSVPDPLGRRLVVDALEDRAGGRWAAAPGGLIRIDGDRGVRVAGGGTSPNDYVIALTEMPDGALWAASSGSGLWEIRDGQPRHYTSADGLPAEPVRILRAGRDGTLWIGTFGAGLVWRRHGRFHRCSIPEGLLSDNIAGILEDRAGDLWLSTTRGICKVTRTSLDAFAAGMSKRVKAEFLGVSDGLRSAQCAPSYPSGGGGAVTSDGWLWFPTAQGLALLNPAAPAPPRRAPLLQVSPAEFDGQPVTAQPASAKEARFGPGDGRLILRYAGIYLRAPEAVRYQFRLDRVDRDWVDAGGRRTVGYSNLGPGHYRFHLRADAGGPVAEKVFEFNILPHFYQTAWFAAACALSILGLLWGAWQLRLRTLRARFRLVLDERARMARELHDTLAQDFVGLSALLDAVALRLSGNPAEAQRQLELARKMVRHSLTEARRSVMDLRAAALQGQSLDEALASAAPMWVAGSALKARVEVEGTPAPLPDEVEPHLLRIAQEALHNAARHSKGGNAWVRLVYAPNEVTVSVRDDGQGFDPQDTFDPSAGHFGILGMQERAERIGGAFRLESHPGAGTLVEVRVPVPDAARGAAQAHSGGKGREA